MVSILTPSESNVYSKLGFNPPYDSFGVDRVHEHINVYKHAIPLGLVFLSVISYLFRVPKMPIQVKRHLQLWIFLLLLTACNHSYNNDIPNPDRVPNRVRVDAEIALLPDSLFLPSGNAQLDSLLLLAAVAIPDENLAQLYYDIGDLCENNDPERAKGFYLKLYALSDYLDWNQGRWLYAYAFSIMLARDGLTDSALVVVRQGLDLAMEENNTDWIAQLDINMGKIYLVKGWYETALNYFLEAIPYLERNKSTEKLGNLYQSMCQVYRRINNLEKSIEYGEKSVALLENSPFAAHTLHELALTYSKLQQYDIGNQYLLMALDIAMKHNNIYIMEFIYYQLGVNAMYVADFKKSEMYLNKMVEISPNKDKMRKDPRYLMLHAKLEQLKGNFVESEKSILEALNIAKEWEASEAQRLFYLILCELSVATHKNQDNIRYWNEIDMLDVVIANNTTLQAVEEMGAKYESAQKELEIARQQQIIKSQDQQRNLFIAGILICIAFMILLWNVLRQRNRHNRELAEINVTKDKFFRIISHDLKNPALSLRDALQLLSTHAGMWKTETLTAYCTELLDSANAHVELLYSLLNWAQLQTGSMNFQSEQIDIVVCLPKELTFIRNMAEKKGVELVVKTPSSAVITGDCTMLATVVRNLLVNAIKFTPTGGTVTLEVAPSNSPDGAEFIVHTELHDVSPPRFPQFSICVSDTGIGMCKERINNLFRLDKTQSRRGTEGEQGTGMGLIVCKELLEQHGTFLHVESEVGKGSRFWFLV